MNLLEERLRGGLDAMADEAEVRVRAADVIAAGDGVRRQRVVRRSIAGVAAAIVAGLAGWYALSPHPITVNPTPLATPSTSATSAQAYFGFDQDVYHLVSVRTERSGDSLTVQVSDEPAGGQAVRREFTTRAGRFFLAQVHENLAVAVIPEVVTRVLPRDRFERHWQVPDAGVTLVALWGPADASPDSLKWMGADGVVFSASGSVPSVRLDLGESAVTVFQDAQGLGLFSDIQDRYTRNCCKESGTEYRAMLPGMLGSSLGLLPADARDVQLTTTEAADWTVGSLPGGPQVWFVRVRAERTYDNSQNRLVKSISYTDASGRRVTITPKLEG